MSGERLSAYSGRRQDLTTPLMERGISAIAASFDAASQRRLRLVPALLRAPIVGRVAIRISETAVPIRAGAGGWIERALIDASDPQGGSERVAPLVESLLRSRVGGDFWAPQPAWPSAVRRIVKFDRKRVAAAVSFALAQGAAEEIGVLLPSAGWANTMSASLRRRGVASHIGPVDPWAVLDRAESVSVSGDDDLGLLALLVGRKVHGRSLGFLTGWGATDDAPDLIVRGRRTVAQIAEAALLDGVRYFDPYSGRITGCGEIIERLAAWRRVVDEDRDLACLAGIAWWKQARLKRFFGPSSRHRPFVDTADACVAHAKAAGGDIGVWPSLAPRGIEARARTAGVSLRQIEDGFVRSVGLGSDLLPPCSIVVDRGGIYYDPGRASDLEVILTNTDFSAELQNRALALIDRLLANRVTKYNTGGDAFSRPPANRVVLVPGQVEDDQSIKLGGVDCTGNLDLVRRVREHEPDAFLIYRPHPDVEAGNRVGAVPDAALSRFVDRIDRTSAMAALLDSVDAVHTLTSLAGFEALLRGREVIVHGQPFYCGWGLTRDLAPPERRGRQLTLPELVAGTLILYPRYLDPVTGLLCPPEVLVERLARLRASPRMTTKLLRGLRRRFEPGHPRAPGAASLQAQADHG